MPVWEEIADQWLIRWTNNNCIDELIQIIRFLPLFNDNLKKDIKWKNLNFIKIFTLCIMENRYFFF